MPNRADRIATTNQINELAGRQHGAISASQLAELGLSRKAIRHRVEVGDLKLVRQGVYALPASAPTLFHRLAVAPLALTSARRSSVIVAATGYTALTLHGLAPERDTVELVESGELRRRQTDFVVHESKSICAEDVVSIAGFPVVSVAFAILAISGRLTELALRGLIRDALSNNCVSLAELDEALSRHGAASTRQWMLMRQIVSSRMHHEVLEQSESALEERVVGWLDDEGLDGFVLQHVVVMARKPCAAHRRCGRASSARWIPAARSRWLIVRVKVVELPGGANELDHPGPHGGQRTRQACKARRPRGLTTRWTGAASQRGLGLVSPGREPCKPPTATNTSVRS